ncbi:serine/threonine-protein kinase [Pendulispora albinea]|uniref:Serine/threonine protein kinase n=1 Tax=Pendulispora albinea TaxID=2741071 RepID=A0ABZ2LTS2_9BACT
MAASRSGSAGEVGLRLPHAFGPYMLFDFIGRGGMAQIYLARTNSDLGAARLCVLKLILPEYAGLAQFADMLTYEAKLAAQLGHTNIVQVFDLGRIEGRLFIAMEYVEGFDLNALLRRCSRQKVPLPMEFALYIVTCVLRGLDYAHRRTDEAGKPLGIVHRDVSPSNLLISFDGEVKVCDFGIAHANDIVASLASEASTADEAIKGKAGYMSPEHARGAILDARADVFAAGIVLWELLAGRRLYRHAGEAPTRASLLEQARKAEVPPLPKRSLPREEELHAIVSKALAAEKNDRYPSAGAMLRDLEAYAIETGRMPNPLKLGVWLSTHFGNEVIAQRRMRERAAAALSKRESRDSMPTPIPHAASRVVRESIPTPLPHPHSPSGPPVSFFPVAMTQPPPAPVFDVPSAVPPPSVPLPAGGTIPLPALRSAPILSEDEPESSPMETRVDLAPLGLENMPHIPEIEIETVPRPFVPIPLFPESAPLPPPPPSPSRSPLAPRLPAAVAEDSAPFVPVEPLTASPPEAWVPAPPPAAGSQVASLVGAPPAAAASGTSSKLRIIVVVFVLVVLGLVLALVRGGLLLDFS